MIGGWLGARLKEPSTHAAVGGILDVLGKVFPQYAWACYGLSMLFFGNAVVISEKGPQPK